ncbi:MFS transporter [Catellatospora tritici]|uniref:MFS transporter n=1 Tax=Catellatospora tritici TaxID=2851566 RepID=UPI001C2D6F56|nr:MFS transporter [Catellatospora tritici]MBV1856076.1 MFS transporter [Catellatospora tritici]
MTIPETLIEPEVEEETQHAGTLAALAADAVSTLATRVSFLAVAWLVLAAQEPTRDALIRVGIVGVAQLLAYLVASPLGTRLADRSRDTGTATVLFDLLSVAGLAGLAFFALPTAPVAAVAGLAAGVGALRALSDRTKDALHREAGPSGVRPPRSELVTVVQWVLLVCFGVAAGGLAVWLGPAGVLWCAALVCAAAAALTVYAASVRTAPAPQPMSEAMVGEVLPAEPGTRAAASSRDVVTEPVEVHDVDGGDEPVAAGVPAQRQPQQSAAQATTQTQSASAQKGSPYAQAPPIAQTSRRDLRRGALAELRSDGLVRRLAAVLFCTNLLVQAGAVILVLVWVGEALREPDLLGLLGGAFALGAVTGAVVLSGLAREPLRYLLVALGFIAGGGTLAVLDGLRPVLLLVVVVAFLSGATMSSVTPALGTLLSQRVPAPVRSRVGGYAAALAYLGIPVGTVAGGWVTGRYELRTALAVAVGAYLVALLLPVLAYRTWRQLNADAPAILTGAARLPARLAVTLAYANGQWLVEVRKGRNLLGARHLVKSSEALGMLTLLDVPGVRRTVEEALAADQTEATRQAERMRTELAELEAKLAGLSEMAELSEVRLPAQPDPRGKANSHGG